MDKAVLVLAELIFNEDMGNQIPKYSALFKKVVVRYTTRLLFLLFCNIFYPNLLSTVPRFRTIFALLPPTPPFQYTSLMPMPYQFAFLLLCIVFYSTHIFIPPCLVFILLRRRFPSLQCLPPASQSTTYGSSPHHFSLAFLYLLCNVSHPFPCHRGWR